MVRSESASPRSSTCGRKVWRRENARSCRTSVAARVAFCLICMMSWNDGSVGLCAFNRKSLAIMMADKHVVEVVRDAAGELADHVHLLRLVDLVFQRAPLGGLQQIDDGRLGLAFAFLDRGDEELPPALLGPVEHDLDRGDIALPFRRLVDGGNQQMAVALAYRPEDRLGGDAVAAQPLRQFRIAGIGADHGAGTVDGGDRHRGVIEEAHEADFGGALRIGALVARAVDHQRARGAGHAVGAEGELVIEPHRHGLAAAHAKIDVEHLGLDLAGHRHDRRQERRAVAGDDVGQLQPAGADLGEVIVEPVGQRRVDIDDVARRVDREEPARRVVEIFDGVLQLPKHILLPLAVAGDVGDRPHRVFGLAPALAERPDPHPQPAAVRAVLAGDADLFLLPLALARRLEQAKHGFRDIGIADEHPLHRADILRARRPRQRQIGCVGVDHVTAGIGHRQSVIGLVRDPALDGIVGDAVGEADDARGEGEQVEQPDHGEQRQQAEDIGLRLGPPDGHESDRRRDDPAGHQQHQHDGAAAPRRLVRRPSARMTDRVGFGGHDGGCGLSTWDVARVSAHSLLSA